MADLIRNALVELVELQDMKVAMAKLAAEADYLESPPKLAAYDCMATGYASRRAGAWEAARAALAAPAAPQLPHLINWPAVTAAIQEYADGYELIGDGGDHIPTDTERFLIVDAIHGLLADDEFMALLAGTPAAPTASQEQPSDEEIAIRAAITLLDGDRDHQNAATMRALLSRHGAEPPEAKEGGKLPPSLAGEDAPPWFVGMIHTVWREASSTPSLVDRGHVAARIKELWATRRDQVGEAAQPILWLTQETYGRLMDGRTGKTVPVHVGRTRTARIPLYITPKAAVETTPAVPLLTSDHQGMRMDYAGLLRQVREALRRCNEPSLHEGVRQFAEHLKELGQRWYAGDIAVADEFLQLYCIEKDARAALTIQRAGHER